MNKESLSEWQLALWPQDHGFFTFCSLSSITSADSIEISDLELFHFDACSCEL
uniref:Uncharacterized protein n=1 Tax=Kalanchoe fedtschenkoi TaxID=63787 RepID=A0A7N0V9R0_KALFE